MITPQDFLSISLGVGFLLVAIFASFAFYSIAKTMQVIREFLISIKLAREGIKIGILTFLKTILERR